MGRVRLHASPPMEESSMTGRLQGVGRIAVRMFGVMALLVALVASLVSPTVAQSDRLRIVATNSILGDLVTNVAGDTADVVVLVPTGGDPHTYEPTPADAESIADADIVFENGLGLEVWLDDVFEASGSDGERVVVTDGVTPMRVADEPENNGGDVAATPAGGALAAPAGEAEDGELDPHVWFDVANAESMVTAIETALAAADPANAAAYQANAAAYQTQLDELDAFVVAQVDTLTPEQRRLVTSHDTFGYFAARYGFEIVGTALGSITTEAADPSASEIAALVDAIDASGVAAIFPENTSNPDLLDQIASEADVEVGPELYTDALGDPGSDGGTYIDMITYDVTGIVIALKG